MGTLELIRSTILRMALRGAIGLFLASVFVCPASADSPPPPASPAQPQGLSDQIAGLQAQQKIDESKLANLQSQEQQDRKDLADAQATLKSLVKARDSKNVASIGAEVLAKMGWTGLPREIIIADLGIAVVDAQTKVNNLINKLKPFPHQEAALRSAIADRDRQIVDLDATLRDLRNPSQLQKDLDDMKVHQENLREPITSLTRKTPRTRSTS